MLTQIGDYMIVADVGGGDMVESNIPVIIDSDRAVTAGRPATAIPDKSSLYLPAGSSARMQNVRRQIDQIAGFSTSVLLTGESGLRVTNQDQGLSPW